jgi:hypothetical protein
MASRLGVMTTPEPPLVPFANGVSRGAVPLTTSFRSTWLTSSLRSLRARGLLDQYYDYLPPEHREAVAGSIAGVWLPTPVAVAHYAACDRFELPESDLVAIGAEVGEHVYSTVLGIVVRLAKGAGVTPWTVIGRFPQLWSRVWLGGGVAIYRLGPKEARIEIAGWQCSPYRYTTIAMRGVLSSLTALFCQKTYVHAVPGLCTKTTLGYRISWA